MARLYQELSALDLKCLVMGGHAVRFYGIDRNTIDFDFHVALEPDRWQKLLETLAGSSYLAGLAEESSCARMISGDS